MNDEIFNNENRENELPSSVPENESVHDPENDFSENTDRRAPKEAPSPFSEEEPLSCESADCKQEPETTHESEAEAEPKFESKPEIPAFEPVPEPEPKQSHTSSNQGSINMQFKPRRTPTWVIVLICVIGALYLIISATLIVAFLDFSYFSRSDVPYSHQETVEGYDGEYEIQEHLEISESPKSEGAKTTDGALTVKQISEKIRASVVGVTCQSSANFSSSSVGSGIIMSEDGYIITNNHVIEGMTTIQVVLDDGETYDARLIGSDSRSDLAVIKINASNLKAAEFGDSDKLEQGDPAIAIGNPAGLQLQNTVTYGIISAINRDIIVEDRTMTLIQTDASINPGNSGGPLVNEFGQVIGINTVKVGISYYEGLGFAIPINTAKPIIDELISRGYVKGRPSIGITGTTLSERDSVFYGLPAGLIIEYVHPYSDAFKKGIRRGDIITKMNGTALSSTAEIKQIRDNFTAGDTVTLTIYRNSQEIDIDVILMDEATLSNSTAEAS